MSLNKRLKLKKCIADRLETAGLLYKVGGLAVVATVNPAKTAQLPASLKRRSFKEAVIAAASVPDHL